MNHWNVIRTVIWPDTNRDSDALWSPGFRILHLQNQRDCERSTGFWFGLIFFFFFRNERERYNDVNVTAATSLREFERVLGFERVWASESWELREREKEKEKESNGMKEKKKKNKNIVLNFYRSWSEK